REYADATPESVREARSKSNEAAAREAALALAAGRVAEILGRWQEAQRSAGELGACADEAEAAAKDARTAQEELAALAGLARGAEADVARGAAAADAARASLEIARAPLGDADEVLGPAAALAAARLWG